MKVLEGNTDSVHTEGRSLDPPIVARFIKINVKTYQGYPSLRVELYGCSDGMYILHVRLSLYILSPFVRKRRRGHNYSLVYVRVVTVTIAKAYLRDRIYTAGYSLKQKFITISC